MLSLFAFFGSWLATLLIGAGAVSVPVIIHLLNRRRFKVVTWAAMRFLLAAQRQNTRRMRLEQLILLLVRAGLVLLIVLAMASVLPWAERLWASIWPEAAAKRGPSTGRTHHIFVLDGSLSMNTLTDGVPAFERARQLALQKIKDAPSGDAFSVLLLKENPTWIVGEPALDSRKVARELESLAASHGNSSVPAALGMVAAKLTESSRRFPNRAVYFLTDLQKTTWKIPPPPQAGGAEAKERGTLQEIARLGRTIFIDVGREAITNRAVTDLSIDVPFISTGMDVPILATVQNFGNDPRPSLRVELWVGKAKEGANDPSLPFQFATQKLKDFAPGESQAIQFIHRFTNPGTYAIQVRIENDDLPIDDERTVIVTVKETIPVLLVNGKTAPDRYEQAAEFLRLALNPFPKGTEPRFAPLRPHVISAARFGDLPDQDLLGYDCLFLCDVGPIGPGELRRLETFLRLGGGVVVTVGDQVAEHLEAYDRFLYKKDQGLLPARLLKKVQAPAKQYFALNVPDERLFQFPPLKAFADANDRISLGSGRFRQYIQAEIPKNSQDRTVLTYRLETEPGSGLPADKTLLEPNPALLLWNPPLPRTDAGPGKGPAAPLRYRGKVMLLTSTVNMDWTSWPGSPSFGAMMQELTRLGVSGKLRENSLAVGQVLEEFFPTGGSELDVLLHLPDPKAGRVPGQTDRSKEANLTRKLRTQTQGDISVFRWSETDQSGIYLLSPRNDPREIPFAVNFPSSNASQTGGESDLAQITVAEMKECFPDWELQILADPRQANTGNAQGIGEEEEISIIGPGIAHKLLLFALALTILEVILAWKFGHYSAASGTTSAPAEGTFFPGLLAVVFLAIFGVLGFVLIHAAATGDFLGFMPESFREWTEQALRIPAAAAGEGTRWFLEWTPYFRDAASDPYLAGFLLVGVVGLLIFVYRLEAPDIVRPGYKFLLGGLRFGLILFLLAFLLPQLALRIDRQGWPDVVILLDDSRSMGEPDHFQDEAVRERARKLGERIKRDVAERIPEKMKQLEAELAQKRELLAKNDQAELKAEIDFLAARMQNWQNQLTSANSTNWRPTRLQLAQALLSQPGNEWLHYLVFTKQVKLHIFHLDPTGLALKLTDSRGLAGEITEAQPDQVDRAARAIAALEAEGKESRLGTALKQVIDQYRGASLTAVIMLTDGVTTHDETISKAADYAAQKGVPLYFVGIGDDHEVRDLKLHDLQCPDSVFVNDTINFEARLTGTGFKDMELPVVLKLRDSEGKEKEVARTRVKIQAQGKSERVRLRYQAKEVGRKQFVIEVELPKTDRPEKPIPTGQLRLERSVEVLETKQIRVLYIEGTPRYEFRFIKSLFEREGPDNKQNKAIDLKVVLLDADPNFPAIDRTALADFPPTREELEQYDVVILGDCDPRNPKLGEAKLKMLADLVRGEDRKGLKKGKTGAGLLLIAGSLHNPHSYRGTPLADVMPIESLAKGQPEPEDRTDRLRLDLTTVGRLHQIFRFASDEVENQSIWQKLQPMYWYASNYRIKPLAEVLAVHPHLRAAFQEPGQDPRHPLAVQQFVGSGRTLFYGFDETWRWRFREDEIRFNEFWIQTIRYLSRSRVTRTELRLDRQTPYRLGDPIKVTVRLADTLPLGEKDDKNPASKLEVKVIAEYRPGHQENANPEIQNLTLEKIEGSWGTFEYRMDRTREGKYRFWLQSPDVSKQQPDGQKPTAEAIVEPPPGELDRLRMDQLELTQAAEATQGRFYTLATADQLLEDLPTGLRVSVSTPRPPFTFWNHLLSFLVVLGLLSAEWILRKRKHLL